MRVLIWWSLATLVTVAQPGCTTPFHTATDAHAKGKFDKALERAKVLRRALRAAGVTAPITITTTASSAAPAKRTKAVIRVVWGVTP